MNYPNNFLRTLFQSKKGSFTIEASLIFPIIFLLVVGFIFISIIIYQRAFLYYVSSVAAERISYNWSNSNSSPVTGELSIGENDDLYWRLTDDQITGLIFGLGGSNKSVEVDINSDMDVSSSLPEKKILSVANILPSEIEGKVIYQHNLRRKIIVELESPFKIPEFVAVLIGDKIRVRTSSIITEPTEFIRTVDFVRKYAEIISNNKDGIKKIVGKHKNKN